MVNRFGAPPVRRRRGLALLALLGSLAVLGTQCTPEPANVTIRTHMGSASVDGPGGSLAFQQLILANTGSDPIGLSWSESSPHFRTATAASEFACVNDPEFRRLDPGETCGLEVWFDPTSIGLHSTTLVVDSNPGASDTMVLTGYAPS
jgi:hypothetical protein